MTADAIFNRVIALCFSESSDKSDMREQFIAVLGMCLDELLPKENGMRDIRGLEKLNRAPEISSLDVVIDYQPEILSFLPYGVAGVLYMEDEPGIATQYKNKYESERSALVLTQFVDVEDVYGN